MRHKNEFIVPLSDRSQFLLNLWYVLMRERLVGVKGSRTLRMMRIRRGFRARTGRASLGIDDDAATQKVIRNQRRQPKQGRGRETSRIRNAGCRSYGLTICLGKPVNKLRLCVHRGLLAPVVLREHFGVG